VTRYSRALPSGDPPRPSEDLTPPCSLRLSSTTASSLTKFYIHTITMLHCASACNFLPRARLSLARRSFRLDRIFFFFGADKKLVVCAPWLRKSAPLLPLDHARSLRTRAAPLSDIMPALPSALNGLEPASVWSFFGQLSSIPRPSKQEEHVLAWLKKFADDRGLAWQQDAVGNIVIRRPGSGGGEAARPVIVQGHVDMVTEKNAGTVHDFTKDPLRLVREGDWIKADGTTLGADNGLGVCAALALLDLPQGAKLPPLEALFTVDEETGLTVRDLEGGG
jgi:hypothetical protein